MRKKTQTTKESQPRSPNVAFDGTKNKPTDGQNDIIDLIVEDHVPLKTLIEILKNEKLGRSAKAEQFEEFAFMLTCHAKAEEEALYVAMKNFDALKVPSFEGDTSHAIADQLVQEINATPDDNEWLAKVKVLAESVEHHIEEEEMNMLKLVAKAIPAEQRQVMGDEYIRLKDEYEMLFDIQSPRLVKFPNTSPRPATHL